MSNPTQTQSTPVVPPVSTSNQEISRTGPVQPQDVRPTAGAASQPPQGRPYAHDKGVNRETSSPATNPQPNASAQPQDPGRPAGASHPDQPRRNSDHQQRQHVHREPQNEQQGGACTGNVPPPTYAESQSSQPFKTDSGCSEQDCGGYPPSPPGLGQLDHPLNGGSSVAQGGRKNVSGGRSLLPDSSSGRSQRVMDDQGGAASSKDISPMPSSVGTRQKCDVQFLPDKKPKSLLDSKASTNSNNDYERLDRTRPTSQHLYRPILENSNPRYSGSSAKPNNPTSPSRGATSPLYDSYAVDVVPDDGNGYRPSPSVENRLFLQQPGRDPSQFGTQPVDHSDEIIELQSDIGEARGKKGNERGGEGEGAGDEESQNKRNAKKEEKKKPQADIHHDIPNTNLAIACMVTLCFNLPLGVLAMYFSLRAAKAFQDGRSKLGEKRSRWSIVLSLLGITISTVIISSVVLYIAMQGQRRISRHKVYGSKGGLNL